MGGGSLNREGAYYIEEAKSNYYGKQFQVDLLFHVNN